MKQCKGLHILILDKVQCRIITTSPLSKEPFVQQIRSSDNFCKVSHLKNCHIIMEESAFQYTYPKSTRLNFLKLLHQYQTCMLHHLENGLRIIDPSQMISSFSVQLLLLSIHDIFFFPDYNFYFIFFSQYSGTLTQVSQRT